jgi:RNA polymerase sigma factor for flagellar operon FliA
MKKLENETRETWVVLIEAKKENNYNTSEPWISARNKLAEFYYPIVKKLAVLLNKKHGDYSVEDLNSFGAIGLLEAIDRFDPKKNTKFETFATYRIFGSMYDQVRDDNWIPRLSKQRHAIVDEIQKSFLSKYGRYPSDSEIIKEIKRKTDQDPKRVLREKNLKLLFSMHNCPSDLNNEVEFYQVDSCPTPDQITLKNSFEEWFDSVGLTELETKILDCVYYRGFTLKETSHELEISNARTCSIHNRILNKLEKVFSEEPDKINEFLMI